LVVDLNSRNAVWWRDRISRELPRVEIIVIEVPTGKTWAGFGSNEWFPWMHETWSNDG
jgi:hypothetical protein